MSFLCDKIMCDVFYFFSHYSIFKEKFTFSLHHIFSPLLSKTLLFWHYTLAVWSWY